MLKVLLADDDFLVRAYLKQLIDWEEQGYQIVGDAADGEEAYHKAFSESNPDIIITDVCMPIMDGVTLLEKLKTAGHMARFIMLSCHDDFEYVKKALQLGADEYLLKNELKAENLLQALAKAGEKAAVRQGKFEDITHLAAVGRERLQQDFLRILQELPESEGRLNEWLLQSRNAIRFENYSLIAVLSKKGAFPHSFFSMCQEVLQTASFSVNVKIMMFSMSPESLLFFVEFEHLRNPIVQKKVMQEIDQGIKNFSQKYFSLPLRTVLGGLWQGKKKLEQANQEIKEALRRYFYESGDFLWARDMKPFSAGLPAECSELEQYFRQGENLPESYCSLVEKLLQAAHSTYTDPDVLRAWLQRMESGLEIEHADEFYTKMDDYMFHEALLEDEARMMQQAQLHQVAHPAVCQALDYIAKHYAENLSLSIVAEQVYLSPAYLSSLFKLNVGSSFLEYLTNFRLEKVKDAMLSTTQRLNKIAEQAGFSDYRHFCKVFKNNTGQSPKAYRENHLG